MSDLVPPPRRPAPDELRLRIERELAQTRRLRHPVVVPLVAAVAAVAIVVAGVLGVAALRRPSTAVPATTISPSPAPTGASPTGASPTGSTTPGASDPTGSAPTGPGIALDPRPLAAGEVEKLRARCTAHADEPERPPAAAKPIYAALQRRAGLSGPTDVDARVMILSTADQLWTCVDEWPDGVTPRVDRPSGAVPVVEVENYGGSAGSCGSGKADPAARFTSEELFAVGSQVAVGRVRITYGQEKGAWQTTTPIGGYLHFSVALLGSEAWVGRAAVEYEFRDAAGKILTVQPYGPAGTPTRHAVSEELPTCASTEERFSRRSTEPFTVPDSAQAGVAACAALAAQASAGGVAASGWSARVTTSGGGAWGAVLVNGNRRLPCSLAPSREVGAVVSDRPSTAAASFWFALNPIAATDGQAFWAAGRVPGDVTGISYVLPDGARVPATIGRDGHWMVMHHVDRPNLGDGDDVRRWAPVTVTVTRRSGGPISYRIPFTEQTMCNQVSHGC